MQNNNKLASAICVFMMVVSYGSIISTEIFDWFADISLYFFGVCTLCLVILRGRARKDNIIYIGLFGIYLVVSLFINSGGIGSLITMILPVVMMLEIENIRFSKRCENVIVVLSFITIIFVCIKSFFYAKDWTYYRFNEINPNTMSAFLFLAFTYFVSMTRFHVFAKKILLMVIIVISVVALNNYASRAVLLAMFVYLLLCILSEKISLKMIKRMAIGILIVGMMVPVFYLILYKNNIDITILGKSLYTGREVIWSNMYDALSENVVNWLFGLGSDISLWGNRTLNVHNNYFAVIVDFGVIGFLIFYVYILKKMSFVNEKESTCKKLLLSFISYVFLLGITEVTTMYSVTYSLVFSAFSVALSKSKEKESDEKDKNLQRIN